MSDKKLVTGLYFKRPNERAPGFVKGSISIKVEDFISFARENVNETGWINADLLLSKDGEKLYFTLNDFKPQSKGPSAGLEPEDKIEPKDIPF